MPKALGYMYVKICTSRQLQGSLLTKLPYHEVLGFLVIVKHRLHVCHRGHPPGVRGCRRTGTRRPELLLGSLLRIAEMIRCCQSAQHL